MQSFYFFFFYTEIEGDHIYFYNNEKIKNLLPPVVFLFNPNLSLYLIRI